MTSLNSQILMEYFEKSKKMSKMWNLLYVERPTIADIIDNAEKLFGDEKIMVNYGDGGELETCGKCISHVIASMCFQNKSIQEISEYIINNIK